MWKWIRRGICCCLCMLLLCGLVGCSDRQEPLAEIPDKYQASGSEYDTMIKSKGDFYPVAENERFLLEIHKRCAEIRLTDKSTNTQWYSNPQEQYGQTTGNVSRISSQVLVQYEIKDTSYSYNSYGDAVANEQYSFSEIDNGIRVNLRMGEFRRDYIVPQLISVERYEELTTALTEDEALSLSQYYDLVSLRDDESMDKESKALIVEKFPILASKDCYVSQLRTSITESDASRPFASDYLMEKLEKLFVAAGYTAEMLAADNKANQVTTAMFIDQSIALSVEYSLDKDGLVVRIPVDSIVYDDSVLELTKIQLLPFFGAAQSDSDGYIFVPDGSGVLIHLNNGKVQMDAYDKAVYGQDYTIPHTVSTAPEDTTQQIHLPVFGMKTEDRAFVGIIESGDAVARIMADVSGKGSAYNTVNAAFTVNSSQTPATLSLNAQYYRFYQEKITQCDYTVRYRFLYGDEADYTGMATDYRQYLLERDLLNDVQQVRMPLFVDILQAVDSKKQVLGMPTLRPLALTTSEQTILMLEELQQKGISDVTLQLTGWSNDGVCHTLMDRVDWMRCLGGKKGFFSLVEYIRERQGEMYVSADFQYVQKQKLFDGFQRNRDAARTLENVASKDDVQSVISPTRYAHVIGGFTADFPSTIGSGLSLTWMGTDLNGDYHDGAMIDRQAAKSMVATQMKELAEKGYPLAVSGANLYTLGSATFVCDMVHGSSQDNLSDESIPFYQIVLHGYIPYSSEPLNQVSDYEETVLKLIETGTIPAFLWMYADNTVLKETAYSSYYSVHYSYWIERAADLYAEMNAVLGDCLEARIVAHDRLTDQIYRTQYSNGVSIYVNYGDKEETVEGVTVPSRGYQRVKEVVG